MNYQDKFMDFVMTPPQQEEAKYSMYEPKVSTMRVVPNYKSSGLGELPTGGIGGSSNDWVMPVVVIVVSAMALMTLYAVLKR